jgi:hypothetical protein
MRTVDSRVLYAAIAAIALAGCPRPTIEAHEAAASLRENPHRIGTVAKPAPVSSTTTVQVIGMVQSKMCFLVEETNLEARDDAEKTASYRQKMNGARYAALALRANGLSGKSPWPLPAPTAMIKVRDSNPKDSVGAVVCVQAPAIEDDSKLIVLTMEWPSSQRLLAMWELTK